MPRLPDPVPVPATSAQVTSQCRRLQTLTHMRFVVNVLTGLMLGVLFIGAGNEGSRVLDNYNLLFGILMHHMMTTMMLTVLTCECRRPPQFPCIVESKCSTLGFSSDGDEHPEEGALQPLVLAQVVLPVHVHRGGPRGGECEVVWAGAVVTLCGRTLSLLQVLCCVVFSLIVYFMSAQPTDATRFGMFFGISLMVVFVAQSFGLMIGAVFSVVVS